MGHRFSARRVVADVGHMLKTQWKGLLLVILVFNLGRWALNACLEASDFRTLLDNPIFRNTPMYLLHIGTNALFTGALLHVALIGVDWRERLNALAPFRMMLFRFPAIFAAQLLVALPALASTVLTEFLFAQASSEPLNELALRAMLYGLLANLIGLLIFTFIGLAPAIAISERLAPLAAMLRSARLMRKRGALLFAIYLLAAMPIALLTVMSGMLLTGVFEGHPIHVTALGTPLRFIAKVGINFISMSLTTMGAAAIYLELRRLNDAGAPQAATSAELAPQRI